MRDRWEEGPEDFQEEFVEEPEDGKGFLDIIRDVSESAIEAGSRLWASDDNLEEPVENRKLSADERFSVFDDLYERGVISHPEWEDKFDRYITEKGREQFREDLESVDLSMDDLIDLSEDYKILEQRDIKAMDMQDELRNKLSSGELAPELAPELAQELADDMLEEERLSDNAHETISRTIRLSKRK